MTKHAKLSPSGAHRWIACPGSIALEETLPVGDKGSIYAAEGTVAHEIAELCLSSGNDAKDYNGRVSTVDGFDITNDEAMQGYVQDYVDFVRDTDGEMFVEQRVNFSDWVPAGFGTADVIKMHGDAMSVIDLKYGMGVRVDADDNPQGMCYALGALNDYGFLYDVKHIRIVIVQPRLDHVSEWWITTEDLLDWAETVLKPAAKAALGDDAPRVPGPKQCKFCKGAGKCRELAEHSLSVASDGFSTVEAPGEPVDAASLSDVEIGQLLPQLDGVAAWIKAVEAYAQERMETGHDIPGHKLVEGRSLRKWCDEIDAEIALKRTKLKVADIFTKKLISPAQAEKKLGKTHKVMDLVVKPDGRPTIAPVSDKRPALEINPADGFDAVENAG